MGQSVEDKETRKAQPHVGCHHDNGVHCDIEIQRRHERNWVNRGFDSKRINHRSSRDVLYTNFQAINLKTIDWVERKRRAMKNDVLF